MRRRPGVLDEETLHNSSFFDSKTEIPLSDTLSASTSMLAGLLSDAGKKPERDF